MAANKGFSLIEIIVTLTIMGVAAVFILPNLIVAMEQTKAQSARNNLLAMAAAQQRYFEDNAAYSTGSGNALASSLRLSLPTNDPFTYTCSTATAPYSCTAADSTVSLLLSVNAATWAVTVTCTAGGSSCPP